ncbi:MAG: tRNA uridine-5-carboxymethylaminomethyl(34) synthesis enzyme MnmG [Mollicutes bacterium PWAP]|nr:tRNA uridine-5-carboxymethylaminomethyl(34) synthesis enzyme MnmG [Mollicutes bacterium PWAP]
MKNMKKYDAIIIGGGHAGVESIFALAKNNKNVALVTLNKNMLASMPCNPSIGGPAKGIITKEIDSLGGIQGIFSDRAMIQIKMLNDSKGPAVRALRAQIDKKMYSELILEEVEKNPNITLIEATAEEIISENNKIKGIKLNDGSFLKSDIIILTTGTYMDSYVLMGNNKESSGPDNQKTTQGLSKSLKLMGFKLQRLKTGTPPRVKTSSIDFSKVEKEEIELKDFRFSSKTKNTLNEQISCYITYTNENTHKIVDEHLNESSMYSGAINGIGPRYCPSIEDKIVRFRDKKRHQIFYEPETREGNIIYVNGLSTSMPVYVQKKMLETLPGMKNAEVTKWGYAIEYDAIDSLELKPSLESKRIDGLFFAGQVNGTSGYEEAAAQGLIAGINANKKIENKEPIILTRDQAYLGVLIDDLVTKGTREPYRMLTSRAEYRLLLRNDNADFRLIKDGFEAGLISKKEKDEVLRKYKSIEQEIKRIKKTYAKKDSLISTKYGIKNGPSLFKVITRPEIDYRDVTGHKFAEEVYIHSKLEGYIKKQKTQAEKMKRQEKFKLPEKLNYDNVQNLATEARMKLQKIKPLTIGQASRISGVNPSDIQMIMFYIEYKMKK